jgi:hypothetical protein
MTKRGRWDRVRDRERMWRHGTDDRNAGTGTRQPELPLGPPQRRRRTPSKSELRALAEAAFRTWKDRPR